MLVLNYNGKQHLECCLSSLEKQTYDNFETILIDNASQDDSVDFVEENFPDVKIVRNNQNSGYAGGMNFGARQCNAEYLLFLNNDVEVEPNLIEEMMKTIISDSSIASCNAKVLRFYERDVIDCAGLKLDVYGFPYIIGHNEKDSGRYDTVRDTFQIGTCALVKRQVFEKIGGFDDVYFALSEDIDLCWRAKLAGYRIVITPFARLYHKASATIKELRYTRPRIRYLSERNIIRMLLKNYSTWTLVKVLPRYFAMLLAEMLFYLAIRRVGMAWALVKAVWWNITHFRGTLSLRRKVQRMRVVDDNAIQKEMLKKSVKIAIFKQWLRGEPVI